MKSWRRDKRRGAAAVEFAVLLPFLLYLAVIATDWARLMYFDICVDASARAGALWLADPEMSGSNGLPANAGLTGNSPYTTLQAAGAAEAPLLSTPPTLSYTTTFVNGKNAVVVTATLPFTTITNFPGVPQSQTLTRSVTMTVFPLTTN